MDKQSKIYVAGHRGMVGSAVVRCLEKNGYSNLIYKSRQELNLTNQQAVADFFTNEKPDYVFLCAAKVGGIHANNSFRADFIHDNLVIQTNLIYQSYLHKVKKLLFLGSSCIYPKYAKQPIREDYLLDGKLETTNEPYAIAKIAGLKMCEAYWDQYGCNFISAMPTNLYGPNDNYDLNNAHVLPALIHRFSNAIKWKLPEIKIWGSGTPKREFLHADDLAEALCFLMQTYNKKELINIGVGEDISIAELAMLIQKISGYSGKLVFDPTKPDGTPRKLLDISKIQQLGWKAKISLEDGIAREFTKFHQNNFETINQTQG